MTIFRTDTILDTVEQAPRAVRQCSAHTRHDTRMRLGRSDNVLLIERLAPQDSLEAKARDVDALIAAVGEELGDLGEGEGQGEGEGEASL